MAVIIQTNLPLEQKLHLSSESANVNFPDRSAVYWHRYVAFKQWIADTYYQSAGAALARKGGRYTRHDISHVDDVIEVAGRLLGHDSGVQDTILTSLTPYETYLLLVAILLHDAGNARERDGHEKLPRSILAASNTIHRLQPTELRLVASIAEAHGGTTKSGSKDTIRDVIPDAEPRIHSLKVRARMLAAILRFADELSENANRADPQALEKPYDPPESAIHNLYCTVIDVRVEYSARTIYLGFSINSSLLSEEFLLDPTNSKFVFLVDYIAARLEKCELERQYCNRFIWLHAFERIRVKLEIFDDEYNKLEEIPLDLADEGYPGVILSIRDREPRFDGATLRTDLASGSVNLEQTA